MSYQGQAWVDEVALPKLKGQGELIVMLRVANHAGNGAKKMSGCHASGETLAAECLMGRSTVLKHLRELKRRGLLVPGDPATVDHLPADKRPPVYDLAGAHEEHCIGAHTDLENCRTAAGARSEHPKQPRARPGARSEHPQKNRRSTGVQIEHPQAPPGQAGAQIDLPRVLKSSTKSSKELKDSLSAAAKAAAAPPPAAEPDPETGTQGSDDEERESSAARDNLPQQRTPEDPQSAVTGPSIAAAFAVAWGMVHGVAPGRRQIATVSADATDVLRDGDDPAWLLETVVPFMAKRRYLDLPRARTHPDCPPPATHRAAGPPPGRPAGDCPDCFGSGFVTRDDEPGTGYRCHCRKTA